mgnify:CR=1 FL=1
MQIILLEKVVNLGNLGDIVKVKDGYARNYLLARGKALRATEANKGKFAEQRAQLEAQNLERRKDAEAVGTKMGDLKVTLVRQALLGREPHAPTGLRQTLQHLGRLDAVEHRQRIVARRRRQAEGQRDRRKHERKGLVILQKDRRRLRGGGGRCHGGTPFPQA